MFSTNKLEIKNLERTGHSRFGIASLFISIATVLGIFILLIIAGIIESSSPGGMDEESIEAMIIGLFVFGFIGLDLVAIGLGIAGIFQKSRQRVLAIIGTIIALATEIITISIVTIGLLTG